jgi:hypothetical protein
VLIKEIGLIIISEFKRADTLLNNNSSLYDIIQISEKDLTINRFETTKQNYSEYILSDEIEKGLKDKTLFKGKLKVNKKKFIEAFVTIEGFEKDVLIKGFKDRNR